MREKKSGACCPGNQAGPGRSLPHVKPCLCFLCILWRMGVPQMPEGRSSKRVFLHLSLPGLSLSQARVIAAPLPSPVCSWDIWGGKRSAHSEQDASLTFGLQAPDPAAWRREVQSGSSLCPPRPLLLTSRWGLCGPAILPADPGASMGLSPQMTLL